MTYLAADGRYDAMTYRRCGRSGIQLPAISLGLWHNFGGETPLETQRAIACAGRSTWASPTSTSPTTTGRPTDRPRRTSAACSASDFKPYRDELIVSTKAGWDMWPGPYGEFGSRKYLLASLDQSLARLGLDYVDIFYSHRFDPDTPLEETMGRWTPRCARAGRSTPASRPTPPSARSRRPRSCAGPGHAAAHPPAVLLDAQPVDRGRPARRPGRARRRLHRVLAAGPRDAHVEVPRRRARRVADGAGLVAVAGPADRAEPDPHPGPERPRRAARADAGAARPGLGAARRAGDRRCSSGHPASRSSRTTSPRSTGSTSPTTSWPRSTATPSKAGSTLWRDSSSS